MAITAAVKQSAAAVPYWEECEPELGVLQYSAANQQTGAEYTDLAINVYNHTSSGKVYVQFRQVSASPRPKVATGKFTPDTFVEMVQDLMAVAESVVPGCLSTVVPEPDAAAALPEPPAHEFEPLEL